jgi:hypothetical protein
VRFVYLFSSPRSFVRGFSGCLLFIMSFLLNKQPQHCHVSG